MSFLLRVESLPCQETTQTKEIYTSQLLILTSEFHEELYSLDILNADYEKYHVKYIRKLIKTCMCLGQAQEPEGL